MLKKKVFLAMLTLALGISSLSACKNGTSSTDSADRSYTLKSIEEIKTLREQIQQIYDGKITDHKQLIGIILTFNLLNSNEFIKDVRDIMKVTYKGLFGGDPAVLRELAKSIRVMNVSYPNAQEYLAAAIGKDRFGNDPVVLHELAKSLGSVKLTDPTAQLYLTKAINKGKFGNDQVVLQELAKSLGNMGITNSDAQLELAFAAAKGKFGNDSVALQQLAKLFGTMNITDQFVQKSFVSSISKGVFGKDRVVLQELAKSLGTMDITSLDVQKLLVEAITKGSFSNDPAVLEELAQSLAALNISDPKLQIDMLVFLAETYKGTPHLLDFIYSHWIIVDELVRAKLPKDAHFFGKLGQYSLNDPQKLTLKNNSELDIEPALGNVKAITPPDFLGYGTFGVLYDQAGNEDILLVLGHGISADQTIAKLKENLTGFLLMTRETQPFYGVQLDNLYVYDLKKEHAPLVTERSKFSPVYKRLPKWLQNRIAAQMFDVDQYQNPAILTFALSFAQGLTDPELKRLTISIMQRTITNAGNPLDLGMDAAGEIAIKNQINVAFNDYATSEVGKSYLTDSYTFWNTLADRDAKTKLIFLLGQLAKRGALGYDINGDNQANQFYYTLTLTLAEKLQAEDLAANMPSADARATSLAKLIDELKGAAVY